MFDNLVFKRIRELFGGRVRLVVTGSAPIQKDVLRFFRIALGVPILEGYGQTETSAGGTFTLPREVDSGNVGPPIASIMIKLTDVPEMKYYSKNDEGEVSLLQFKQWQASKWLYYSLLVLICSTLCGFIPW